MKAELDYDQWLDWFIVDHKLNIQEVILEEILDGQPYKVKMVDFLNKTRGMNDLVKQAMREGMSKCIYTDKSVSKYLKKACEELIVDGKLTL
ncbi:MAG: hypothetical protein K5894_04465 [Lachnospiraceae bacterium]|nr:hypothetical protein [Lachnospiraceae bacterium]MDN4743543.1 hypothetical protein [Lachnospiraceae bacterium C1.1]